MVTRSAPKKLIAKQPPGRIKKVAAGAARSSVSRPASKPYLPPVTISRGDFLKDGHDRAFRDGLYAMVTALDGLLRCRDQFGRSLGLTGSQFAVLIGTAYRQGAGGVTIRDLAEHVRLAPPHVTTEVSRLIKKGLLVKRPNKIDGRSVLVSLSPAGEAAVDRVTPLVQGINDILFQNISHPDFQLVVRVMRSLSVNIETAFSQLHHGTIAGKGDHE